MQKMSVAEIYGIPILSTSIAFELGTVACPCVMFLMAEVYHQYHYFAQRGCKYNSDNPDAGKKKKLTE